MQDPEENDGVKVTRNWREYLVEVADTVKVCRWVWKELISDEGKRQSRKMFYAMMVVTIVTTLRPWFLQFVIDGLQANVTGKHETATNFITWGFAGLAITGLVQIWCNRKTAISRITAQNDGLAYADERINSWFFEKSLGQHIQEGNALSAGNIENGRARANNVRDIMLYEATPSLLSLGLSLLFLWFISPVAGLLMTLLLVSYLGWSVFLNQKINQVCVPLDREFRRINRYRHDRWEKIERVKTAGSEKRESRHLDSWFRQELRKDLAFWSWFDGIVSIRGLSNFLVFMACIGYGTWQIWNGNWHGIGILYPFFAWAQNFSQNLWLIGGYEERLNSAMPGIRSMKRALTLPPTIVDSPGSLELNNSLPVRIEFRGVTHSYPIGEQEDEPTDNGNDLNQPVLKDITFSIEPSEKVALIGPSGAGKTTIMRLLQRYMDPDHGVIAVNGHDLRSVKLESWTNLLAYVPQQAQIFNGTIRENLLYGLKNGRREKTTDTEIWDLMRRLQIDFGKRLTEGLETRVGKHGLKLSGGQAQRVMLGAAAISKPRLIIIDEATSSLDSTTEKLVQQGLAEVLGDGMSALIITHRLNTVRTICDKFVVLRSTDKLGPGEPQIEATARSFEDLYPISPTFKQLADDQGVTVLT